MKPVPPGDRIIANIDEAEFENFVNDNGQIDGSVLQLNRNLPLGTGFHVYKMEPGTITVPHEHNGLEEFLLISGDATDSDGTEYKVGDLVLMKKGTQHSTTTINGCVLAVYIECSEVSV